MKKNQLPILLLLGRALTKSAVVLDVMNSAKIYLLAFPFVTFALGGVAHALVHS